MSVSIIDPNRLVDLKTNWTRYGAQITDPVAKLAQQADWSAQLSWHGGQGGKPAIEPSNGGRATNPPSSKIQTVVSSVLLHSESDPYTAYQAAMYPFLNSNGLFLPSAWIRKPESDVDLDYIAVQAFVRNNLDSSTSFLVKRSDQYIKSTDFIELGDIGTSGMKIYAFAFNPEQYITEQGTRRTKVVKGRSVPTTGTFGYVTLALKKDIDSGADLKAVAFSAVPNSEFHKIAGSIIYLDIVHRFLEAQQIGKAGSFYGASTVAVRSNAFPYTPPITIPIDSLAAWRSSSESGTETNLKLIAVDDDPTTVVETGAVTRFQPPESSGIPTVRNVVESLPENAPPVPKAALSGSSIAFLTISSVLAVVGIICLIALIVRISTSGRSGSIAGSWMATGDAYMGSGSGAPGVFPVGSEFGPMFDGGLLIS